MELANSLAIFCEKTARLRHMIPLELFILLSSGMRVNNGKCNLGFQENTSLLSDFIFCSLYVPVFTIRRTFYILCNGPRYQSEQYVKPTVSSTVTPSRRRRTLARANQQFLLGVAKILVHCFQYQCQFINSIFPLISAISTLECSSSWS